MEWLSKLSNDSTVSKFVTKKWVKVNNLSSGQYSVNKNIRFKTSVPRSDLCYNSDAYVFVLQMKMIKLPKMLHLKIILHLDHASQKLTVH